jgi:hypothetical protein
MSRRTASSLMADSTGVFAEIAAVARIPRGSRARRARDPDFDQLRADFGGDLPRVNEFGTARLGESAITASTRLAGSARKAAASMRVESTPPENPTATLSSDRSEASSRSAIFLRSVAIGRSTDVVMRPPPAPRPAG